eukprot:764851-Hanusia_phi.AAC.3
MADLTTRTQHNAEQQLPSCLLVSLVQHGKERSWDGEDGEGTARGGGGEGRRRRGQEICRLLPC